MFLNYNATMETLLLGIFATIFLATLLNIVFKKYNISHILGYIFTGTIISYLFDFNTLRIDSLELVSEFGIVFLTIEPLPTDIDSDSLPTKADSILRISMPDLAMMPTAFWRKPIEIVV